MKRVFLLSLLIAVVGLSGWGCTKKSLTDEKEALLPVRVSELQPGTLNKSLTYSGDIVAETEIKVFSKIPDRIEKFYVDESEWVNKGDRIAEIFATTIQQTVRQAEAGLAAAQAQYANTEVEYSRVNRLFQEHAISKQQFDLVEMQFEAAKSSLQQAEAGLKSIKSTLADATVSAPISGIIGKRYYEEGDMANPAMPLVSIVQMNRVKVSFNATEEDLSVLRVGLQAQIDVRSYPDQIFSGKVLKISPVLDPLTRMATVEVLIENPKQQLKPGMFAKVRVITGKLENVLIIPRNTAIENTRLERIDNRDQVIKSYSIFVVQADSVIQRPIQVQYMDEEFIAIATGAQTGEKVVIEGQNKLSESSKVMVIEEVED
jgi:RND family efflux transporter MFP subunit